MLSQIQTDKLTHIFNILDFDSDRYIQKNDFKAIGENLTIIRGFDFDSEEITKILELTVASGII